MSKLGTGLIIIGLLCFICAASNDDYYGAQYSLMELMIWMIAGVVSILIGYRIRTFKGGK